MNYSTTLLRLTKAVLLVTTLLGYCASLPAVSWLQRPDAMMDGAMDTSRAPKLKQLQKVSHGTRTHQFPANSTDSLERDMCKATAETTPNIVTTSGDVMNHPGAAQRVHVQQPQLSQTPTNHQPHRQQEQSILHHHETTSYTP